MAGKAGRSGRKKSPSTLAKEALERNEMMLPTYLEILHSILEDENVKDRVVIDTAKYLIDRSQGRPKAIHDLRFGKTPGLTAEDYELYSRILGRVEQERWRLIGELEGDAPKSLAEVNEIVRVQSISFDIDKKTFEIEFQLPSGLVEKITGQER